jgi:hypothetical protein
MDNKSMLEAFEQVYGINARKRNQSQKHYHGWQKKLGNKQKIIKEITRAIMWYKITGFSIIQCFAPQA